MTILELILRATETELRCALRSRSVRCEFRAALRRGEGSGAAGRSWRGKVRCVEVFKKRKWLSEPLARARVALNFTWSTFNLRRTKPCRHGRALLHYIDGGFMKLWPSGTCTPCNRRFYLLVWSLIFHLRFSRSLNDLLFIDFVEEILRFELEMWIGLVESNCF